MLQHQYETLIFDLGGVIIDLDISRTLGEFATLSGMTMDEAQEFYGTHSGFLEYETGQLTDTEFRQGVYKALHLSCSDAEFDKAWNAMLAGLPKAKLSWLKTLASTNNVLLLSNTNSIHLHYINSVLLPEAGEIQVLDDYFAKAYYSHLLKMRKPSLEIYQHILEDQNLTSSKTVFLDDNLANLEGAEKVGIHTRLVTTPNDFYTLLS